MTSVQTMSKGFITVIFVALLIFPTFIFAQNDEPLSIGASLPITGTFSINGIKHQEGYELCVNLINEAGGLLGRQIELIIEDNRSDVEQALTQHERLISDVGVDLLFGTFSSRLTFPTSAIAYQNDMVLPIPGAAAIMIYEQGFDNLFYFQQLPAEYVGRTPINALVDLVGTDSEGFPATAAFVHADDFFANGIATGIMGGEVENSEGEVIAELPSLLEEAGMEIVYNETWPGEGFTDWLTLANSLRRADADALFAATASPEEVIQLTRAMQTVGYQPDFVYFSQGSQIEYFEGVGEATEGVVVHLAWHPQANWIGELNGEEFSNADFIAAYEEVYGVEPDEDVAIPFALCQGMAQAVEGVGSTDNVAINEWLHARTAEEPVKTIIGDFYWDERGLAIDRTFILGQWQDGTLEFVYPTDEFEGTTEMIFPKPEW